MSRPPPFRLAFITGATSGIGRALAFLLADRGVELILSGRNLKELQHVAHLLEKRVSVTVVRADLARGRDRSELVKVIKERAPDLLINSAGFGLYGEALDTATRTHLEMVEVNGTALLELTLAVAKTLIAQKKKGVIVNLSSAAATLPFFPNFAVYAATKAFVLHLSRSLDEELSSKGVRVLASCPGMVATAFRSRASKGFSKEHSEISLSAEEAAGQIFWQITKQKPYYLFDWKTRFLVSIGRFFLPRRLLSPLLKRSVADRVKRVPPPTKPKREKAVVKQVKEVVAQPRSGFAALGLSDKLLRALDKMGFKEPSPIQREAIPLIQGGSDLIGQAETGSGKTAACAIPICDRVNTSRAVTQALIIVPTRELALQYATETQKIGGSSGVKVFALYGGEDYQLQEAKLTHGVHVLIATPGRLIDFIYRRLIDLSHVETLILDEADEMLSMGFYEDLEFIIQCLVHDHQTLLFSATMPEEIRKLAKHHMKEPKEVVLTGKQASPREIAHRFAFCQPRERQRVLMELLEVEKPKKTLIFCQSRLETERVAKELQKKIPAVDYLHGGLNQKLREGLDRKFRTGRIRCLVTTDIAARGIDIADLSHVFIYSLSSDVDTYIHRSGRTGRQKKRGTVITLVTPRDLSVIKEIASRIGEELSWIGKSPQISKKRLS